MIKYHVSRDYGLMNSELQRGGFSRAHAPYLTWCLSIWPDQNEQLREVDTYEKHRNLQEEWVESINAFMFAVSGDEGALFKWYSYHANFDNNDLRNSVEFTVEENSTLIEKTKFNEAMMMKAELFDEYAVATFLLYISDYFSSSAPTPVTCPHSSASFCVVFQP